VAKRKRLRKPRNLAEAQDRLRTAPVGRSHFHRLIHTLPGGPYYTVVELAFLVERTPKTLKEWVREKKVDPASKMLEVYGQPVYLYTVEDVERFRQYAESH
jgi:hypothetical protein